MDEINDSLLIKPLSREQIIQDFAETEGCYIIAQMYKNEPDVKISKTHICSFIWNKRQNNPKLSALKLCGKYGVSSGYYRCLTLENSTKWPAARLYDLACKKADGQEAKL